MGERKDSSLLISLKELQEHEASAEAERRAAMRRREDAARAAQMERERLLRLAAERERADEESRRADAERARLDEAARRAAAEHAAIERERIEARARMDADREREQRRHELELARLGGARSARSAAWFGVGSMLLTSAGLLGAYYGVVAPAHERALASARDATSMERQRADEAERVLGSLRAERKALTQQLGEISHDLVQAKPKTPEPVPVTPVSSGPRPGGRGPKPPGNGICDPNASPDDPLSCDKRLGH